jgi:hypothetical protein
MMLIVFIQLATQSRDFSLMLLHKCLFVCFELQEQFFSYLATVTITSDRAVNLDICLALTAFSNEGSYMCHTYCDTGPPFIKSYLKDLWFLLLNAMLLAKEQLLPILNVLGLMWLARKGHNLPDAWARALPLG